MSEHVVELTDGAFDSTINDSKPVLVDFWAPWCGPCKMLTPVIEEIAAEYDDKVTVCKMNTDDHRDAAVEYGISAIPTIILFKDGQVAQKWVGLTTKQDMTDAIDELLG